MNLKEEIALGDELDKFKVPAYRDYAPLKPHERVQWLGARRALAEARLAQSKLKTIAVQNSLREVLANLGHDMCEHSNIFREGSIWTKCEDCGRRWADDRGGFVPYVEPEWLTKASALANDKALSVESIDTETAASSDSIELEELREECSAAKGYMTSLIKAAYPDCVPLKTLTGLVSQLDNILSGSMHRVVELEKSITASGESASGR